ncbi:MAG TPA: rRNA maturation RNase YbeY [Candidatus Methylacidiphilales bacterium]|nr:rRNA maturation RNase YbeY [Candidatus Methylacidiphilales bacterium]
MSNRQSETPVRVRPLLRRLKSSLPLLPRPLPADLSAIHVVLVDRATIARVHGDFLGDPTETDVITFPYGEILVCPAVARDHAGAHGLEPDREVLLYALHGLLHLAGYDDMTPASAKKMAAAQSRLLKRILAG